MEEKALGIAEERGQGNKVREGECKQEGVERISVRKQPSDRIRVKK